MGEGKKTITLDYDAWELLTKKKLEDKQKSISALIRQLLKTNKA